MALLSRPTHNERNRGSRTSYLRGARVIRTMKLCDGRVNRGAFPRPGLKQVERAVSKPHESMCINSEGTCRGVK